MRTGRRTRAGLVVAGLVVGLCGLTVPAVAAPSPSVPTDPATLPVTVAIEQITPVLPQPGDDLTVSGHLTNTGDSELRTVAVRLRLSPRPVESRTELERLVDGSEVRISNTIWASQTEPTPTLAAGASMDFTISLPVGALGLTTLTTPGVQVIGVEALGDRVVGDGLGAERVGLTTTFLPWYPAGDEAAAATSPTGVVWLWPFTATPAVDGQGVHLGDELGAALAPGGRLRRMLDLAATAPVPLTYLLDPALLETVAAMTDGYQVRDGDGELSAGSHAADAARWLADLRAVLTRPGSDGGLPAVLALAYAQPDVVALHRAGLDLAVTRAITEAAARVQAVIGRPVTATVPWPPDGRTDAATLDLMLAAGAKGVLLSSAAMPLEPRSSVTPDGVADLPGADQVAVLADARLGRALSMPTGEPADALLARQRLIAGLEQITLEDPADARTVVVAPPPLWDPDTATIDAWWSVVADSPFAAPARYEQLVTLPAAGPGGPARSFAGYPRRDRRAELPSAYLERVSTTAAALAGFRSVTSSAGGEGTDAADLALGRTVSALWRDDLDQARRLLGLVEEQVGQLVGQVRVVSQGTTIFPGETGVVPVVIANDLDQPARVGIALTGTPAVRFDADPFPPVTIDPHTKASVEVPARVVGSGDVVVDVQLVTADGLDYGPPVKLTVRSTAYGRVAAIAALAAFGLLALLLAVNFVRRRRRPGLSGSVPDDGPADGPDPDADEDEDEGTGRTGDGTVARR